MKRELLNSAADAHPEAASSELREAATDHQAHKSALPVSTGQRAAATKTAEEEDVDLAALPRRVDRRALAHLVSKFYFPVSPRTVEAWPLVVKRVNGRATIDTREGLAFAKAKLDAAPAIRGGRRTGGAAA
jgi:hypothetical protein